MKVLIPKNPGFNYLECKQLYIQNLSQVDDIEDFDYILKTTFFYSFIREKDNKFIGCLYFYLKDNKLYVNGYSNRHCHLENIECLKLAKNWFNCDIWAQTPHRTAAICLLRAGFKKVNSNTYVKMKGEN